MEQKSLPADSVPVQRYFEYKDDAIMMHSRFEGDYGEIMLMSFVRIYEYKDCLTIHQEVISNLESCPLEFRVGEMNYLLSVALLFNPKTRTDYGLPQTSESEDFS